MVEVGKLYKVFNGKVQKVVKVTDHTIYAIWPNGQTPARMGDYAYPIEWAKHFTPLTSAQ